MCFSSFSRWTVDTHAGDTAPIGRCVVESLGVMLEIFEATVVNGLVGDEIVEYMGQGRTAVAISP